MSIASDIANYIATVNANVSTQTDPNSIDPTTVGDIGIDLAELIQPYLESSNNQSITQGTTVPSNAVGSDLDLYYRNQPTFFELYRKEAGVWVLKINIPFSVVLPDGNLTVRTSIDGFIVTATKGGWVINGAVYQKITQTQLSIDPADLNFGRIDNIYANTSGNILYEVGTPAATPVAPALPVNTILIDQVIVPASSSGDDPYLLFGGGAPVGDSLNFANSTGLITGGVLSVNADPTKFNVSAGTAVFVDYTSPIPPTPPTAVNFGPLTGVVTINLNSSPVSYIGVNGSGGIVQQVTPFTPTQRRSIATLGILIHTNLTVINAVNLQGSNILAPGDQLHDFMEAVGPLNQSGNRYSAGSTNLTIQKTAGTIFKFGSNSTDYTNPNTVSQLASNPTTFRYRTQNGEVSGDVTNINPAQYDNGGVLTPVGANDWTVQRITVFQTGLTRIQYGQTIYPSFAIAQASISTESFVVESNIAANGIFRAYLIVKGNATNLSLSSQAVFLEVPKFGGALGASGTPLNVILNQSSLQVGANFNIDGLGQTQGGLISVGSVSNYAGMFTGTSTAPDTSGGAVNGALSVRATGITDYALDIGVEGTYSWLQSRNPLDHSVNRELKLNPNGGNVTLGVLVDDGISKLQVNGGIAGSWYKGVVQNNGNATTSNFTTLSSLAVLFTGTSTNYPLTTAGVGFGIDRVSDYSNVSSIGSFKFWTASAIAEDYYIKKLTAVNTWSAWRKLWHDGNSNLSTIDWNTALLTATGANAAPATSGSAANGSIFARATGITNNGLAIGIDGTNNYAWIQARNPTDYSVNRELRLNPNGGNVTFGSINTTTDTNVTVHNAFTTQNSKATLNYTNLANAAANQRIATFVQNDTVGGGGIGSFHIRHINHDGVGGFYSAFRIAMNGTSSSTEINSNTTLNLQTLGLTRASISSTGAFILNTLPATAGAIGTFDDIVRNTTTGALERVTISLATSPYILNQFGGVQTGNIWINGNIRVQDVTAVNTFTISANATQAFISGNSTGKTLQFQAFANYAFQEQATFSAVINRPSKQVHTAGTTTTLANGITSLYVNPASLLATLTITLPAAPTDGQEIYVSFGGTITAGAVVTTLSIIGNTGHTLLGGSSITTAQAGDGYIFKFESSTNLWRKF